MFGNKGFGAHKTTGVPPPRSGASSVNVSGATSMGDFGGGAKSNLSSGVSSPSIDVMDSSGTTSPLPPMDSLPTTGGGAPQPPIPLAPRSNPFTANPSTSFGGGAAFGVGSKATSFGSAFGASNKAPPPTSAFGAAFSTPTSSRAKPPMDSPILDPSPISKSSPQTAGSPSISLSPMGVAGGLPSSSQSTPNPAAATSSKSADKDTTNRNLFSSNDKPLVASSSVPVQQTTTIVATTSSSPINPRYHPLERLVGWDENRIQAMRDASNFNKAKLAQLDAIGIVQYTADTLVTHDAGLATHKAIIEAWLSKVAGIKTLLDKSELELNKLIAENPVLAKTGGAAFAESVELQDLWLDKQDEFVDTFVSYRDRYLTVLRGTKLVKIGKAVSVAAANSQRETWDRAQATYGAPGVLGQYLRLEE